MSGSRRTSHQNVQGVVPNLTVKVSPDPKTKFAIPRIL